jgi:hypothetical protein
MNKASERSGCLSNKACSSASKTMSLRIALLIDCRADGSAKRLGSSVSAVHHDLHGRSSVRACVCGRHGNCSQTGRFAALCTSARPRKCHVVSRQTISGLQSAALLRLGKKALASMRISLGLRSSLTSRTTGEKRFDFLFMAPISESVEPPQNPGRFNSSRTGLHSRIVMDSRFHS